MKIILMLFLSFVFCSAFSQSIYKFKLDKIDDPDEAKHASDALYPIFDKTPEFKDESDLFIVRSITSIKQEVFERKCADLGYVLIYFLKNETHSE